MIPLPIFSQKALGISVAAGAAAFLGAILLYQMNAQPLSAPAANAEAKAGTTYLTSEGAAAGAAQSAEVMREVHIANNGLMLLRGARVTSVSGNTIRVTLSWGSSDFTWVLLTDSGTTFLTASGEKQALSDIRVGDIVTATGTLNESGSSSVISADFVRE